MSDGGEIQRTALAQVRALQESKLLNPDISLSEIVSAAERIPGLGGEQAGWELITHDYVYRGRSEPAVGGVPKEDVAALRKSEILNFDMKLSEILEMSQRIPGAAKGSPVAWELVSHDFILRGKPTLERSATLEQS
jgi:hypothetical protein